MLKQIALFPLQLPHRIWRWLFAFRVSKRTEESLFDTTVRYYIDKGLFYRYDASSCTKPSAKWRDNYPSGFHTLEQALEAMPEAIKLWYSRPRWFRKLTEEKRNANIYID